MMDPPSGIVPYILEESHFDLHYLYTNYTFEKKDNLLAGKGVCEECISEAEAELGLTFAQEYREYLKLYGIAAYDGHELTGLTKSARVNVIAVTKEARKNNPDIPLNCYVVEETNVEEILIWQSSEGKIFCSSPNSSFEEIYESLSEYIDK